MNKFIDSYLELINNENQEIINERKIFKQFISSDGALLRTVHY
jgi:hypothetical protein